MAVWDDAKKQWVRAAAVVSLTDNSGGVANDTIQDVPVAYGEADIANNFADLAAKMNAVLTALRDALIIKS